MLATIHLQAGTMLIGSDVRRRLSLFSSVERQLIGTRQRLRSVIGEHELYGSHCGFRVDLFVSVLFNEDCGNDR